MLNYVNDYYIDILPFLLLRHFFREFPVEFIEKEFSDL